MIVVPVERRVDWKRPPVVLIGLVLVNLLVFFLYQSDDAESAERAVELYRAKQLLELEVPAYKAFLRKTNRQDEFDLDDPHLTWYMVNDRHFSKFIQEHKTRYIPANKRGKWSLARAEVDQLSAKISINAFGLNPHDISPLTLISYQFLHGGLYHLIANMVFLILTGFAVEAALGSRKFFVFYLVSGVGAGLLFSFFQLAFGSQAASLVGASGSISGVMAMYLVLYGLRKIEFFYWVFIFTGYFRAAAIVMLPAYLLKELYFLIFTDGSNVAYIAHIGGFVAGGILIYLTQSLVAKSIDTDYLDGVVDASDEPYRRDLQTLYSAIGRCDFKSSYKLLKKLRESRPHELELVDIELNLLRALSPKQVDAYLLKRLGRRGNGVKILQAQAALWNRLSPKRRAAMSFAQKGALIDAFIELQNFEACEEAFNVVAGATEDQLEVATLARKISNAHRLNGSSSKAKLYDQRARDLIEAKPAGMMSNEGDYGVL